MKEPVDGVAQVVGSTQPPDSATSGNVSLTLVVQAEGVAATTIEHSCLAPTKKWPYPGTTLPVTFDRADPDRLKVRWDDLPDSADVSRQRAEAIAAQLNQGGAGSIASAGGNVNEIVQALQQQYPGAEIEVQGAGSLPGATPPDASGDDDRIEELERLAKLKESGALTQEEFEREKARILGS
jgi:hypothetical protein